MHKVITISYSFRHLILSVSLLWACMLYSQEVIAYTADNVALSPDSGNTISAAVIAESEELTLKQAEQFFSHDATSSVVTISLQQASTTPAKLIFAFPTDEAIPPYAARAPGVSFLSKFFPTSIQPHAP